jgi:hypothetical protein
MEERKETKGADAVRRRRTAGKWVPMRGHRDRLREEREREPRKGARGRRASSATRGIRGQQKKPLRAVPGVARDATAVRAGAASSGIVALRI